MGEHANVEIRILDKQAEGYPVELTLNNEQEFGRGFLDPDQQPDITFSPGEDGKAFFAWLTSDPRIKAAWSEIRGQYPQRRIRLRIDAEVPGLHAIPWEIMREPADGVDALDLAASKATPFSRYLAGRWQPGNPILKRPIRILVAMANPEDLQEKQKLQAIEIDKEWSLLQEATQGLDVELTLFPGPGTASEKACTLVGLEAELKKGYHILHFIGHGSYSAGSSTAVLYMADENNKVTRVKDEAIASMLARQLADTDQQQENKLRLVFLASCQTANRSPADAFRGLAPRLVAAGVPAVLAMQDLVPVDTARQFATTFYKQLLDHGAVDLASNEARSAVLSANLTGAVIPVLFSRLRSCQLLGKRGQITSANKEMFWPFLIQNIALGQCTPFLGPGVTDGLLPNRAEVAQKLAEEFGYPLPDSHDLAKVAQFISLSDPEMARQRYARFMQRRLARFLDLELTKQQKIQLKNATFSETTEALKWREHVLKISENEIHHLLAGLELPLYVTTNFDNFMVEALKDHGRQARRITPRWKKPEAGSPQHVLTPDPSAAEPVVLQLNGHDGPGDLSHLVLAEDDYMAHFLRLAQDQGSLLPMNVLQMLSEHSFLFLGYQLDDWEFRVILQGLIKPIAQTNQNRKVHVGVQLGIDQDENADKAMEYLGRYLGQFHIDIYWGTAQQFVTELHGRWQEYLIGDDDEW